MDTKASLTFLERGHIYFFYRPKVQESSTATVQPQNLEALQRFFLILQPSSRQYFRLLILGRKRLPNPEEHEKHWAHVEVVTEDRNALLQSLKEQHYATKTRGERILPEVRTAGEGVYGIIAAKKITYLAYQLELPQRVGAVQKELEIEPEAIYVLSVKNQDLAGVQGGKKAEFPADLSAKFADRRFIPVNPVNFLDYTGAELLLVGVSTEIQATLGIKLKQATETLDTAEIFNQLKLWKNEHPIFPASWAP